MNMKEKLVEFKKSTEKMFKFQLSSPEFFHEDKKYLGKMRAEK